MLYHMYLYKVCMCLCVCVSIWLTKEEPLSNLNKERKEREKQTVRGENST